MSVQISVSCASRRSKKCRPSAWSMSVMRRSLTPPSIDPPSSSSIAPSSSVDSVESSICVPDRLDLEDRGRRVRGHRGVRVGPRQLRGGQDLELQRHAQLGGQTRRRGAAERLQRAAEAALLLGRELRRAREVDRAHAAAPLRRRLLLGQPAVTRGVDQRGDRVLAQNGSAGAHDRAPPRTRGRLDAARPRGRSRDWPRRARGSCGRDRRRSRRRSRRSGAPASCSRTAASLRCPTSSVDVDTANMLAPPTRTASSIRPPTRPA